MDRPYRFRRTILGVATSCVGFVHPAPETGDFYSFERCFSPEQGITRAQLHSVWGNYELELGTGPTAR